MVDLNSLISQFDILFFLVYAIAGYIFMQLFVFKNMGGDFYLLLKIFFLLKLISAALMSFLTIYYWKEGDAIFYYSEGQNLFQLFRYDPSNLKYLILPVEEYHARLNLDNVLAKTYNGSGQESSFLVSKFCAVFYYFSIGKYLLINFFFCLFSTIAQLKLYLVLAKRYPHGKKMLSICILFMPTLLLYSSSIFKETLCLAFIALAANHYYNIVKKNQVFFNGLFLLVYLWLIYTVKYYVLYAFLTAVCLFFLTRFINVMLNKSFISKSITILVLFVIFIALLQNLEIFDPYVASFADTSNFFQDYYNNEATGASFEIGEMETTFKGLLQKIPVGFYTTFFRPHLWEVRKPIVLFSAMESFLFLCLTLFTLLKKRKLILSFLRHDSLARLSMFYCIVLATLIGLTTFNFGTLIRYKVPIAPFAWLFIFLLLYYIPIKKIEKTI